MTSLVIVDSGSANLSSVYKAARMVSLNPTVTDDPRVIARADALIFPGVGSFDHAASKLSGKGLQEVLLLAIEKDRPFLGICLGMQLLLPASEESFETGQSGRGLAAIGGLVKKFPSGLPVPHVGWNRAKPIDGSLLFRDLEEGAYFYFTHSYYAEPDREEVILAKTEYGFSFTSAVNRGNVYGVQFHPEKSGPAGLRLLANFGKIIADPQ